MKNEKNANVTNLNTTTEVTKTPWYKNKKFWIVTAVTTVVVVAGVVISCIASGDEDETDEELYDGDMELKELLESNPEEEEG